MDKFNPIVDQYLIDGCGRCEFYKTPRCKVHDWVDELKALRAIVAETELTEDVKWSFPCYTLNNGNVALLSAFRDYASLSFFKGSLLKDERNLLTTPGQNSMAARYFKFTSVEQVEQLRPVILEYLKEAIENERAGLKVEANKVNPEYPEELIAKFEEDPIFKNAFESLTPGRQRGYLYFFNGAKQSKTRAGRIEKYAAKILDGKGMMDDRYKC